MRLLKKSEVSIAKAAEKKREIDEGLKLARRIDGLRETWAEEDAAFQKFRSETIAKIHDDITKEQEKLGPLKKEVKELEESKAEALKPLTEEKAALKRERAELDRQREEADERESLLRDKERKAELALKRATATVTRAELRENDADSRLQHAAQQDEQATLANARAQKVKADADERYRKVNQELLHRDMMASERERSVTLREESLARKWKEFIAERTLFKDRKATFERELKRNKK